MGAADVIYEGKKVEILDGSINKYNAAIDLKKFYNELHDWLYEKGFRDTYEPANHVKDGDVVDDKGLFNRTGDMIETHFVVINKGDAKEYEIKWKCARKVPDSEFGKVTFELDLSVRNCKNKEFLDGNDKKVLQDGGWEFRNKLYYENNVVEKYIDKIPFIKNIDWLKKPFFGSMYSKQIDQDLKFIQTEYVAGIKEKIEKHFLPGS